MITGKTIVAQSPGVRLDAAILHAFPSATRAFVRDAIAEGNILVNDRRVPKGLKLRGGETIVINELLEAQDNLVAPVAGLLKVEFEDDAVLAFDKPSGMPVQPLNCRETGTLMNAVVAKYPECRTLGDAPLMAGALHRIDADTSGLVLVARTAAAFENLREQFSAQTVRKTYLALVEGAVAVGGTLENDLIHDPTLPFCRMIDIRGQRSEVRGQRSEVRGQRSEVRGQRSEVRGQRAAKPLHAVTSFKPIAFTTVENEERTLLEVEIFTGVTHQIRAQLALAGMHIVNDRLYGAFAIEGQTGHCLHALAAEFAHPLSGLPVSIRTAYPAWARI